MPVSAPFASPFGSPFGPPFAHPLQGGVALVPTYYVDATSGLDTNDGLTSSTAFKTVAKINGLTLSPDDVIAFKRGEVWREQLEPTGDGTDGHPIAFTAYSSGAKPVLNGADLDSLTGWTGPDGNGEYYKAYAVDPNLVFGDGELLTEGTVGSLAATEWGYSGGNLYLGQDPVTYAALEVPVRAYGVRIGFDYLRFDDLSCTKVYNDLWSISYGNSCVFNRIEGSYAYYSVSDGFTQHNGTTGTVVNDSIFHHCQRGITCTHTSAAEFNRCTVYECAFGLYSDTGTYVFNDCIVRDSTSQNIKQTGTAIQTFNRCLFKDSEGINAWLDDAGTWNMNYCQIIGAGSSYLFYMADALAVCNMLNCTLYDGAYGPRISTGTLTVKNSIIYTDTAYCMRKDSGATLISDNNCYYRSDAGNAWNYEGTVYSMSNLAGWKTASGQDTNSIAVNPLFESTSNFNLQSTSPCINAGVDLGLVNDYDGCAISGLPDIGAYESKYT